jgi:hypothetical protein
MYVPRVRSIISTSILVQPVKISQEFMAKQKKIKIFLLPKSDAMVPKDKHRCGHYEEQLSFDEGY